MKTLELKAIRVVELAQVVDSISPKELSSVKDIRLNVGLINDLNDPIKELSDLVGELNVKRNEALKPYQVEYQERSKGLSEEDAKVLASELDKRFNEEHGSDFKELTEKINTKGEENIKVELSDEKHEKLCDWVKKFGMEKYVNKRIFIEVCDALGIKD